MQKLGDILIKQKHNYASKCKKLGDISIKHKHKLYEYMQKLGNILIRPKQNIRVQAKIKVYINEKPHKTTDSQYSSRGCV